MGVRKIVLVETCSVCQVVQEPVCFQIILKMFQTTGLSLLRACPETGVRLVPACPCLRPNHHVLLRVARETKRQRETEIEAWWKGVGGRETFWLTAPSSQSRGWNADEVHVNQEQCSLFSSYSIFISLPPIPPYTTIILYLCFSSWSVNTHEPPSPPRSLSKNFQFNFHFKPFLPKDEMERSLSLSLRQTALLPLYRSSY